MAIKKAPKNREASGNLESDEKPEAAKKADKKAAKKPDYPMRGGMYVINGKRVRPEDLDVYEKTAPAASGALTTKNSGGLVG